MVLSFLVGHLLQNASYIIKYSLQLAVNLNGTSKIQSRHCQPHSKTESPFPLILGSPVDLTQAEEPCCIQLKVTQLVIPNFHPLKAKENTPHLEISTPPLGVVCLLSTTSSFPTYTWLLSASGINKVALLTFQ